jgi:hypothetical protein
VPRRLAAYTALTALSLGLAFAGAAPAFAADAPVAGTTACTNLVSVQSDVEQAATAVQKATNTLNTDLRANPVSDATVAADRTALGQAQANQTNIVNNVTNSLCTGTAATTTTTTTDPATPTTTVAPRTVPATETQAQIDAAVDALTCTSTNADVLRIDRAIAARQVAHETTREVTARLHAKIDGLGCSTGAVSRTAAAQTAKACGCVDVTPAPVTDTTVAEAPSTVVTYRTVNPTQDDNSVAKTSGTEVTDVPAGSASTGSE